MWQAQEEMRLDVSTLQANAGLSPREALVVELFYGEGWKLREIAAHCNVKVGTIKTEKFRAEAKLKKTKRHQGSAS
jgi:RNA polymerase sigma factor (sigma-70 family)